MLVHHRSLRCLRTFVAIFGIGALYLSTLSPAQPVATAPTTQPLHVESANSINAGRYLFSIASCNDCHTPGYTESGGKVPESQWLIGTSVGWRGPWGTTYASNLRIFVRLSSEDDWVKVIRARNGRPPMPWSALHAMSDADL